LRLEKLEMSKSRQLRLRAFMRPEEAREHLGLPRPENRFFSPEAGGAVS
jgi:hypothetical protein